MDPGVGDEWEPVLGYYWAWMYEEWTIIQVWKDEWGRYWVSHPGTYNMEDDVDLEFEVDKVEGPLTPPPDPKEVSDERAT